MRNKLIIVIILFSMFLAIGCAGKGTTNTTVSQVNKATPTEEGKTATQNVTENTGMKDFTLEELSKYNGSSGTIYVAYQGKVYDVSSDSNLWKNGNHKGCTAGKDVTEEMDNTPHGAEILKNYPVVGTLKA